MTQCMNDTPTLPEGIHENIGFSLYRDLEYLNSGALRYMDTSPMHCRAALDGDLDRDSDDMRMGRAFHVCLLEPEAWESYAVSLRCAATMKSGVNKGSYCQHTGKYRDASGIWWCGKHAPEGASIPNEFCTVAEKTAAEEMREAVMNHPVGNILHKRGGTEITIIWQRVIPVVLENGEEITTQDVTITLKARIDKLVMEGHPISIDLKSCAVGAAYPHKCRSSIDAYGYNVQAAMYRDAVRHATEDAIEPDIMLVFCEKKKPYDVCVMQFDAEDIDISEREYESLLLRYAKCVAQGKWPGGHSDVCMPSLPAYRREE